MAASPSLNLGEIGLLANWPRWRKMLLRYYDLYQRLQLQFYVLLMMGTMDTRHM